MRHIKCNNTGCWNWTGYRDKIGRGRLWHGKKFGIASRYAYEVFKGKIKKNLCVCHKCDNYSCINPDHFFIGTDADNMKDRDKKNRTAKGEKIKNSKLKTEQVKQIKNFLEQGLSQQKIADLFGVHQSCISSILRKKTWKHI